MFNGTLIQSDNIWLLIAFVVACAAAAVYLEQKTKWGAKITGPILGLVIALTASNLGIIPMSSPAFDVVSDYLVPVAVVLILFKADIRSIFGTTKKELIAFHIAAVGTFVGTIIGVLLLAGIMPAIKEIAPAMCATYIGGSINFVAMTEQFSPSGNITSAALVADNLVMAIFVLILTWMPSSKFFRKHFKHPYETLAEQGVAEGENKIASYWQPKPISLLDISLALATAFLIAALSSNLASFINANTSGLIQAFFGNQYVILTTLTLILVSIFPNYFKNISGADEIGSFFIYMFFVTVGIPASLKDVITQAPLLLVFSFTICAINLIFALIGGKITKCSIEEIVIASDATLAGPSGTAALAIAKGWNKLIIPALLVGLWGYVIGNYCGVFIAQIFGLV